MTTEEEIFEAAAALPKEERAAYLDIACGGQPQLRDRLLALLKSHDVSGFLLQNALQAEGLNAGPEWEPAHQEESGILISRYRLLEKIGEGGFGVVWDANQVVPNARLMSSCPA